MENRNEPQSLQYFFRLLDIRGCGYLDGFTLKYFFRVSCLLVSMSSTSSSTDHRPQAIQDMMMVQGQEPIEFEDVKDEIFDMVKPQFPLIITLQDLITWCVCGEVFVCVWGVGSVCMCVYVWGVCMCVILVNYN